MSTIINTPVRTGQIIQLLNEYSSTNYLYLMFGETTPWANESLPPAPVDSYNYIHDTVWANTLALSRVTPTDITPIKPRYDWAVGVTDFVAFDPSVDTAYTSKFYCVNSRFQVFELTAKGTGAPATGIEPIYVSGQPVQGSATTGDLHEWTYLYTISPSDVAMFLTPLWMPINYGAKLGTAQEQADGDVDAIHTLGCTDVGIYHHMLDTDITINDLGQYRRVALVSNPLNNAGSAFLASSNVALSATPNTRYTGNVLYTENRTVVHRYAGQSEEIRIVLAY